jgi:hypothetical protein
MTYHPRFGATDEHQAACVRHPATPLREIEQEPGNQCNVAVQTTRHLGLGTSDGRSAVAEMSLAHAVLSRLFPTKASRSGKAGAAKMAVGLLIALVSLLAVIVARSIA